MAKHDKKEFEVPGVLPISRGSENNHYVIEKVIGYASFGFAVIEKIIGNIHLKTGVGIRPDIDQI